MTFISNSSVGVNWSVSEADGFLEGVISSVSVAVDGDVLAVDSLP